MAIDNEFNALNVEQVQTLTNIMAPDILQTPAIYNYDLFTQLRFKVLTGIEFKHTRVLSRRKGGITRRYDPADRDPNNYNPQIGYLEERELKTKLVWLRAFENLQNFREKEPFSILGTNGTYNAPVSEKIIRDMAVTSAEDIVANTIFGDGSRERTHPYSLFDGVDTLIAKEINEGKIGAANGNYLATGGFVAASAENQGEVYAKFKTFHNSLHPKLLAAKELIYYVSVETLEYIVDDYLKAYPGFQSGWANEGDIQKFRFFGLGNVTMIAHPIFGSGSRIIATVPENIEFGLDTLNDTNRVSMTNDPFDLNVMIFQVQSNMGMRIKDTTAPYFAVNDQVNIPRDGILGDYTKSTITVSSNNETWGSVAISPVKAEYTQGETVTLTATAETAGEFVKWSDEVTINPRTVVFNGAPAAYQAVFAAKSSD